MQRQISQEVRSEPSQSASVRRLLSQSADALHQARRSLFQIQPDYHTTLSSSLQVLRLSLRALVLWHSIPVPEDLPLRRLTYQAKQLAPMLLTYEKLSVPLEELAERVEHECNCSNVADREIIQRGYYTARNTLDIVLRSLPAVLKPDGLTLHPGALAR